MNTTTFKSAVQNTPVEARTLNGMKTYESSLNKNVDFFYQVGASRGKDVTRLFADAYSEDRLLALRIAAWARDVRGGAGERQIFRDIIKYVEQYYVTELDQLLSVASEYGRWDDLLSVETKTGTDLACKYISAALLSGDGLCAKWMPRQGKDAVVLRRYMNLTPKQYRKMLVNLSNTVEQKMCAQDWTNINYEHVPSLAAARYQKAFGKHDPVGYGLYANALSLGEAKINANAVYPYDVIKSLRANGNRQVVAAQWDALPNFMGDANVLPIADVSGSMCQPAGGNKNVQAIDVSISLGLYCASKNTGAFKDVYMEFSSESKIQVLSGNIVQKYEQLNSQNWGMSTNLHGAFDAILKYAVNGRVPAAEMPKYILILSDMEFNACAKYDDSAIQMIRRKYEAAGYEVPSIIFWNLASRSGTVPVSYNEKGVALVSGFSPAILESILKAKKIDPVSIMLETVNSPRYQPIV